MTNSKQTTKASPPSPWDIYYRKIRALFGKDPEITFSYDGSVPEIHLFINNQKKADALSQLLPSNVSSLLQLYEPVADV